ncbi:hypothetical protein AHFPHNDE_03562 [Pseudomonas sp. MM227]|jgi:hypothetical protein|uniref:DUF2474 domain-containing protein n=1 Tax=Pseudomonas baltica TaxID=2762576 RepID=A0A7X1KUW2_9PSED|nr:MULTISPECIES: DUF2474 domain-containing protein [Pseudomonas]RZA11118.1 MAG: DUF2474 domain-containing protein [Pseudomonadota bacterium]MBC2680266.1 DUF2474 domain-containing protein [Pseudomonas baltica]MBD8474420.1 DUF2474 domain-containing protein [Pseudomonas sp. CFBP 8773]MBD8483204.1 DUF2474 domain-containing protein [Pseudomonas coleopterorum]MBD8593918.1 DUF2474 domain-containing protein [Pseudomonas sp. CFBP 8758]
MSEKPIVTHSEEKKPLWKRLGWLVVIYAGSVVALGLFAMLIRLFMTAAGMKSH